MAEQKTLVWVVGTLHTVGGGELLLLEGAKYYRSIGFKVHIITWDFNEDALFDGSFENKDIHILNNTIIARSNIFKRALNRIFSVFSLRKKIKSFSPSLVICQSEYDVVLVRAATLFTNIPYCLLIFGQTFQFPYDLAKYSFMFKKHLTEIVNSMAGYKATTPLKRPKTKLINVIANEIICWFRYHAVRHAALRVTFSEQVRWEISKLYNIDAEIFKGAYPENIFDFSDEIDRKSVLGINKKTKVFLSLSRLDIKKRVDLCIEAFSALNLDDSLLLIGGKGAQSEALHALTKKLGIQDKVRFLGYVPQKDVWGLKAMADVFVSLDIAEFDLTAFEALALGTKVVWTDEIDMDENMKANTNIFVAQPNQQSVTATMKLALEAPEDNNINRMKEYTWSSYFNHVLELTLKNA